MPTPFSRTTRALDGDSARRPLLGVAIGLALLAGWSAWFFITPIAVFETTDAARLEAGSSAHVVQAPVAGKVVHSHLQLGRAVEAGELLLELEPEGERLALNEQSARLVSLGHEISALQSAIAAEQSALHQERRSAVAALEEARSHAGEAEPTTRFAEEEIARLQRLRSSGMISEIELMRRRSEAERQKRAAESATLSVGRLDAESRTREQDRLARIERMRQELATLEGQRATADATSKRLEFELARRRIVAPAAGLLGNVTVLRAGAFVDEGDALATIVPAGRLHAVAEFPLAHALGRIHPGQPARLRLTGLPWAQYGSLGATVEHVASEGHNGLVRVELAVTDPLTAPQLLEHGLAATAEVEVERTTAAVLVLRAAGSLITTPLTDKTHESR